MTKHALLLTLVATSALLGCRSVHPLDKRYVSVRAPYDTRPLPNAGDEPSPQKPLEIINEDPKTVPDLRDIITGTWTFTTPRTTTRVKKETGTISQFLLYQGRPQPADQPIVTITVSPEAASEAEANPDQYTVKNKRKYTLNGAIAEEWTGTKSDGTGFTELVLSHPLKSSQRCHALATAKNPEQQKLAVEILSSLKFTPSENTNQTP
jgi:hypothetical protein